MSGKRPIEEEVREKAQDFRDVEIEYQLVAYLLRSNPTASSMIQKDWLSDILLQDVWSIVADLKLVMSKPMVLTELRSRKLMKKDEEGLYTEVVDQLFAVDISPLNDKNVHHMMEQVLQMYETRRVLTGCGEIIASMRSFDLDSAKRKCSDLGKQIAIVDRENAGFYLEDYPSRVESMMVKEKTAQESEDSEVGIRTGIYRFDKLTGGLMPKEFGVILGVTGVGKTAGLIEFGVNAWEDGHDVMLVSGEMDKELMEFRIDSRLTRIHGMKFRNAELDPNDYKKWDSTIKMYTASRENTLYVAAYPRRFTVETIERDIVRVQEETGRKLQVLCMDYINIMEPIHKARGGGWEDQSEAVWDFKGLLAEHNLRGWTAGQVKDEAYDKELYDPQDAKYARAISEAAPIIVAFIRTPKDILEGRMKFQVLKMRNADTPRKPIVLTPNLSIMRLHEDLSAHKTLKGKQSGTLDEKAKTKSARPRRSLHGR